MSEPIESRENIQERSIISDSLIRTKRGNRLLFPDTYKILIAGDVMLNWGVETSINSYGSEIPFQDWIPIFESAHKRVINFESTITNGSREPYQDKAFVFSSLLPDTIALMRLLKIDAVSLGNNHVMDYQVEGMRDTISAFRKYGILTIGAGENDEESYSPIRWNLNGNFITLFSASDVLEKNYPFSNKKKPGVALLKESIFKQLISKENNDTNTILSLHWGMEYSSIPMLSQRRLAKSLLDSGYSAIIGHHTHVPQGIEIHKGKPIVYSLGNFIFGSRNIFLNHNIVVILHYRENRMQLIEIIPSFGKFQNFDHIFFPLAPREAEDFLEEYSLLCKKLGTDIHIQGGRGYIFLDKTILKNE